MQADPLGDAAEGLQVVGSSVSAPGGSGRGSLDTCHTSTPGGQEWDLGVCGVTVTGLSIPTDSTTGTMNGGRRSSALLPSTSILS